MPLPVPVIDPPVRLPHLELPALAERAEGFNVFWHREAKVTHIFREEFYKAWSPNKAAFLRRGFNIRILGERTYLYQSLDGPRGKHVLRPREEAIYNAASKGRPQQESLPLAYPKTELVCPKLPDVLESKLLEYQIPSARQILRALKNGKTEWGYEGAWDSSDAGTGKTYVLAAVARASGLEVCVVCPKGVIGTYGRPGRPGAGWLYVLSLFGITPIFVEGYESLRTGKRKWIGKTGKDGRPFEFKIDPQDHIILWDEAHRLKNPSATRSLAYAALRQDFPCLFASATMAESPLNLGATGMAVGLHKGDIPSYERFLAQHGCTRKGVNNWDFDRYHKEARKHLAAIHHKVFPYRGSRVRIADLGAMFPETQILLEGVSVENERAINEAFNLARTAIATMRRQGASEESLRKMGGAAYIEALHKCERAKVPGICEKAEEELDAGRSVAIFVNFSDVRIEIMRRLNARCGIYGGQSTEARNQAIADFQSDKARVIVCNIEAGGVGVSLHDVRGEFPRTALICMSNNAVTVTQTFGRVHRSGGKSKSRQLIIFATGTLEEDVVENIRAKKDAIDSINDGDLNPYF